MEEGFVPPHRGPIGPPELVQEGTEELHVGPQSRERFLHSYELGWGGRETPASYLNPLERGLKSLIREVGRLHRDGPYEEGSGD